MNVQFVCPQSGQALHRAPSSLVAAFNREIKKRRVVNQKGEYIKKQLSGCWIREDQMLAYPVLDHLAVFLVEKAIPLDQLALRSLAEREGK